jgi:hypothetical protein
MVLPLEIIREILSYDNRFVFYDGKIRCIRKHRYLKELKIQPIQHIYKLLSYVTLRINKWKHYELVLEPNMVHLTVRLFLEDEHTTTMRTFIDTTLNRVERPEYKTLNYF